MMRQVENFMIARTDEDITKNITNVIGTKILFETENNCVEVPIEFLSIVDDYNGVDINQTEQFC